MSWHDRPAPADSPVPDYLTRRRVAAAENAHVRGVVQRFGRESVQFHAAVERRAVVERFTDLVSKGKL